MSFVTPLLLAGASLVAVPIVLHLIMRQQPKHLEFPAIRFLQLHKEANRRQLRLRHLLLLLMRCLAIILIALALARPSIDESGLFGLETSALLGEAEAPVAAALVFDTSPRMMYRHQNKTRLDDARETALWLLSQLPDESAVAVVDGKREAPTFSVDLGVAQQRLEHLDQTAGGRPLIKSIENSLRLLGPSDKKRKELYIFTDLSKGGWPVEQSGRLQKQLAMHPKVSLYVIDVGVDSPRNFFLSRLEIKPGSVISTNTKVRLEAELSCEGPGGERTVELYLLDAEGQPQPRGHRSFQVNPGESQLVEFPAFGSLEVGTQQGYLQIEGQDNLAIDDQLFFTIEVKPQGKVLIAAPAVVYANFFKRTLDLHQGFETEVITQVELANHNLDQTAAVCLLDPSPLPEATWHRLYDYASAGGSVAIFLGRNAKADSFNLDAAQQMLPGRMKEYWTKLPFNEPMYLEPADLNHVALRWIHQLGTGEPIPWNEYPVFKFWQFTQQNEGINVLMNYQAPKLRAGRLPALLERSVGSARVLTMTTPVSDARKDKLKWNLLPHAPPGGYPWPLIKLIHSMMLYMTGNEDRTLTYRAGRTVEIRLGTYKKRKFLVIPPDADTPAQGASLQDKQYTIEVDPQENTFVLPSTNVPGNYRILAGGAQKDPFKRGISVNISQEGMQLERLGPEALQEFFGDKKLHIARNRDQIDRVVSGGRIGLELFPYLMVLIAALLVLEHVLASRFYQKNESAAQQETSSE